MPPPPSLPIAPTPFRSKPVEHMPDVYLSAIDLQRKLVADSKAADEASAAKLKAQVEALAKKAAEGKIEDLEKRRLDTGQKLLKGAKGLVKLAERHKFKNGAGDAVGSRLSSSVMLHPSVVRAALASMG